MPSVRRERLRRGAAGRAALGLLFAVASLILASSAEAQSPLRARSQAAAGSAAYDDARAQMVEDEIAGAGVKDPRVLDAVRATPRHEFVRPSLRHYAYYDMALPIGEGQTISPPFVVSYMTEALEPQPDDRVLEIGTGSGYQAAVLSPLVKEVYTIEIVPSLGREAARTLARLGYKNVHAKVGDGYQGWPEHAPFNKIIVTCSPEKVPPALEAQLAEGGRMVIPVGERYQQTLYVMKKVDGKLVSEKLLPTLFVPMTGAAEEKREVLPDPRNPSIVNGGFEDSYGDPPQPSGWHYQRQLYWQQGDAPEGAAHIVFRNADPGRGSQALQGFAVDGRAVRQLLVSVSVRGNNLQPGAAAEQMPALVITFYDERRATVGTAVIGPWRGSFDWHVESKRIEVPLQAREAIVHIGLFGAVGELSLDAITLKAG